MSRSSDELAAAITSEFERRWNDVDAEEESVVLTERFEADDIDISIDDFAAAARELRRPFIRDAAGLPPAALLGSLRFLAAALEPIKCILGSDEKSVIALQEQGYVKQKENGGKNVQRLRALIPNSTILRLLSNIVRTKILPKVDEFSCEHEMNTRVLGGGRGGQPLDIIATAQMVLQIGRDNDDKAAIGQLDIRNYHDSFDRLEVYKSLRRRSIPSVWCCAAVRLQRCAQVCLTVKGITTGCLRRTRGALTGNRLAPIFGRVIVEDTYLTADCEMQRHFFQSEDVVVTPMAWSDNLYFFARSIRGAAKMMETLDRHLWDRGKLQVKEDSLSIIPACTRKLVWPPVRVRNVQCPVVSEAKSLGYHLSCSGDTCKSRQLTLGALRGCIRSGRASLMALPSSVRARWWQAQFRGYLGFFAAFLGLTRHILQCVEVVDNGGARFVAGLRPRFNHHATLTRVKEEYGIEVQNLFVETVVRRLGHVFRHATPLRNLYSLPLAERLASRRLQQGSGVVSEMRLSLFHSLRTLGIDVQDPVGGRPGVRGHSGYVHRWGDPWFESIRDDIGWNFDKLDTDAIGERVQLLMKLLERPRSTLEAIRDAVLPIEDG